MSALDDVVRNADNPDARAELAQLRAKCDTMQAELNTARDVMLASKKERYAWYMHHAPEPQAEVDKARDVIKGLADAIVKDSKDANSISGFTGARLSDARAWLAAHPSTEQGS